MGPPTVKKVGRKSKATAARLSNLTKANEKRLTPIVEPITVAKKIPKPIVSIIRKLKIAEKKIKLINKQFSMARARAAKLKKNTNQVSNI